MVEQTGRRGTTAPRHFLATPQPAGPPARSSNLFDE